MMYPKLIILSLLSLGWMLPVQAQFPIKTFEAPAVDDALDMESYAADPQAKAVYLFDINQSEYVEEQGGFSILYTRRLRIKVFAVEGTEVGVVRIPYKGVLLGDPISNLSGGTYYKDSEGKVVFVPLEEANISDQQLVDRYRERIVVFPQVKPGAVLELSYNYLTRDIEHMPDFEVQDDIPKVMAQYYSEIPMFYSFRLVSYGKVDFETFESYPNQEVESFGSAYNYQRLVVNMVAKDVPAFEREPYMPNPNVTKGALAFVYVKLNLPDRRNMRNVNTWPDYNRWLLATDDWKGAYGKERLVKARMPDRLLRKPTLSSAQEIYSWVQQKYGWNGYHSVYPSFSTREFTGDQPGNLADVNLTLLNALRAAGFEAYPVVSSLSTYSSQLAEDSPLVNLIRSLLVEVIIDGETYFLNAAVNYLPFGTLLPYEYNGLAARIDEKKHTLLSLGDNLSAIFEYKAEVRFDAKANQWVSDWTVRRDEMALGVLLNHAWLKETWDLGEVTWNGQAQTLFEQDTAPVPFSGIFPVEQSGEQWLVPRLVDLRWQENPFVAETRVHSMQFEYPCEHNYRITIHIPEGYQLAEMPAAKTVVLPQRKGLYYYAVKPGSDANSVRIECSLRLTEDLLPNGYYPHVRQLFQEMAANHNDYLVLEPIVEE